MSLRKLGDLNKCEADDDPCIHLNKKVVFL